MQIGNCRWFRAPPLNPNGFSVKRLMPPTACNCAWQPAGNRAAWSPVIRSGPLLELRALISLLMLKKIVPNLMQLGDCRLEWRDEEPLTLTSHQPKAIESLERIGNFEIKIDCEIFRKPRLDAICKLSRRWRYLRLADEVICECRFLGLLVLGSSNQVVKNARIIVDITEVHIFSELHVVFQRLMLIFQPLAHGKATERYDPHQCSKRRFHVGVRNRP